MINNVTIKPSELLDAPCESAASALGAEFMERLDFSDTAKQMAALKAALFNIQETNDVKIQFIKEELSAGRYQIQSKRIADRLLEFSPLVEEPEIA